MFTGLSHVSMPGKQNCGTIKYLGKDYSVTWDSENFKVYVSKVDNPALADIHYTGFVAPSKAEAPEIALKMLEHMLDG